MNDINLHIDTCVHKNADLFSRASLHLFCHMRVSVQRECGTIVAVHANTYGIYPSEITALQKDYADLWEPLSELLKKLAAVVSL